MIRKISNSPRDYAWGSTSLIPDYFGSEPTGKPMAEIWFGTHPASESILQATGQKLSEFIGANLKYLFKILAAGQPLSIQAHPTKAQAVEGFARENSLGIALDAANRNYKDDQPKPEMVVALTTFRALAGFRDATEIELLLAKLQLLAKGSLADEFQLYRDLLADSIEKLFTKIIDDRANLAETTKGLALISKQVDDSQFAGALALVAELEELYPGDPGVIISLMMNYIELQPGEAMQLNAGEIHAYLSGLSLELMTASDNVLRGGLTSKHIDVAELKKVLKFEGKPVEIFTAKKLANGAYGFPRLAEDYQLFKFELSGSNLLADLDLPSGCIGLCTAGEVTIFDSKGETATLKKGEAAYLADARLYSLTGSGTLFVASS